jgi:hypothetical protein
MTYVTELASSQITASETIIVERSDDGEVGSRTMTVLAPGF